MPLETLILIASEKDIQDLILLVNSAYRGESSKKGWTTEAELLDGLRTDEKSLNELFKKPGSVILKCTNEKSEIIGCVNLQSEKSSLYLGMLTVSPNLQGGGIGKKLLISSEEFAIANNFKSIVMTVISVRKELIAWYERHGYGKTGESKPFPTGDPSFGIPLKPLEFIVLEKKLQERR